MDYQNTKTSALIFRFVIPQMIGMLFNSVYFIVDGIFIGKRLGTGALAAAGVAVPLVEGMIAFSMLIAVGTGVIVSSAFGKGDKEGARSTFNISMAATLALSVLIALLGSLLAAPLARALGAGDAILADTVTYLRTFVLFSPFLVFSFVLSTCVRNDGKPGLAMWSLTIGSFSNILLDWFFMYPLNMGIFGAALATGLGPVFSVLILLPHFLRKKGGLYFAKPRFSGRVLAKIAVNGLPAFVAEFSVGIVTLLYNLAIVKNGLGDNGLAAYLVIGYASLIAITAFLGAAQGVQPLVSYFAAAENRAKIRSLFCTTVIFCTALAVGLYGLLYWGGGLFYGIFIENDITLLNMVISASRIYFINLPFAAINILVISFLQSKGMVKGAMVLSLSRSTVPVFLFLLILPMVWGSTGLWTAIICAEVFTFLLSLFFAKRDVLQ